MKRSIQGISLIIVLIAATVACNFSSPTTAAQTHAPTLSQVLLAASSTPTFQPPSPTVIFTQIPSPTPTHTFTVPAATATPDFTSTPEPDTGRIFFTQCLSFASLCNIMVVNADGSGLRQLTNASVSDNPVLSPDGQKIAFISNREGGDGKLYVMNADGSRVKRLTNDLGGDRYPSWSPDSQQIVFAQNLVYNSIRNEEMEIAVINSDGKNLRQLTHNTVIDYAPDWSPDGSKIAYDSDIDGYRQIFVMDPDGSNVQQLTSNTLMDCNHPKWSPDGHQIALYCQGQKHSSIYVMEADGSNFRALADDPELSSYMAVWSPNGNKIIFTRSVRKGEEWVNRLFIVNIDGSNLHQLLFGKDTESRDDTPFWAP